MNHKSRNALTFGLYAQDVILPWENADEFNKLHDELRRELDPEGVLQEQIVRDIAIEFWRKRRVYISEMLPFYKSPVTPELMEAAKGGTASLAAYIPLHRRDIPSPTGESPASQEKGISAELIEQAYDISKLEKIMKAQTMIDNRISKLMGQLVAHKSYQKMYGQKVIERLPSPEAPALGHADAVMTPSQDEDRTAIGKVWRSISGQG